MTETRSATMFRRTLLVSAPGFPLSAAVAAVRSRDVAQQEGDGDQQTNEFCGDEIFGRRQPQVSIRDLAHIARQALMVCRGACSVIFSEQDSRRQAQGRLSLRSE